MTFRSPATNAVRRSPALRADDAWVAKYMPIPFVEHGRAFRGADCRGLVFLILEHEAGERVPELAELIGNEHRSARDAAALVQAHAGQWRPVPPTPAGDYPRFCVLLFTVGGLPTHVAVSMGGRRFIHTQKGAGVRIGSLDEAEPGEGFWGSRLEGAYQYGV
jgi:cell wall-associated NlpC family hydrolase